MKKKKTSSESFLLSRLIKPVILFVLIILVYSKTTDFGYTNFDDRQHIVYQEEFYQEDYSALKAFTHDVFPSKTYNDVYYRPLLTLTLLMDYKRGGTDPAPYHGTNLVLFILAMLFLYYLIRNFTRAKHLAFALTALYALHPMFTSTVAWIPGRNDSLLAIFAFSGFIFLIKYLNNTDSNKWFFLHLLALTLALFTKESAVVLIPLFGLFIYLFRDRKTLFNKHHLQVGGGWIILAIGYLLSRWAALEHPPAQSYAFIESFLHNIVALPNYIGKLFTTLDLSGIPIVADMNLYVSIAGLLIAGLLLFFSKNRRLSLFGLAWFVFFLLPGIIVTNPELKQTYQFEHRAFVPMLGIMLMILAVLKNRLPSPSYRWYHYTVFLACLGVLALRSSRYAEQFSSPLSFFSMTAENSPSCTICAASLGTIYSQQGRAQEAVEQYRKAIRLEPDKVEFYTNLSLIHLNQNQAEQAREVIDQAKALQIDSLLKAKRLAEYYLTTRRLQQARRYLEQAESIDSTDAEVNRIRTHLEKIQNQRR